MFAIRIPGSSEIVNYLILRKRIHFVKDLLSRMTVEEKIGQLSQYVGRTLLTGPESEYLSDSLIARGLVGSCFEYIRCKDIA